MTINVLAFISACMLFLGAIAFSYRPRLCLFLACYSLLFLAVPFFNARGGRLWTPLYISILPAMLFVTLAALQPAGPAISVRIASTTAPLMPMLVMNASHWKQRWMATLIGFSAFFLLDYVAGTWPDALHVPIEQMQSDYSIYATAAITMLVFTLSLLYYTDIEYRIQLQLGSEKQQVLQANRKIEAMLQEKTHALTNSEEKLSWVLEASNQYLWEYHAHQGTFTAAPNLKKLTGYPVDELVPEHHFLLPIIDPEDQARIAQSLERMPYDNDRIHCEYRIHTRQQEIIWLRSHARVLAHDAHGRPVHWVGTLFDITQEKQAKLRLHAHLEDQELISQVSGYFNRFLPYEEQASLSLKAIKKHFNANRVFLTMLDQNSKGLTRWMAFPQKPTENNLAENPGLWVREALTLFFKKERHLVYQKDYATEKDMSWLNYIIPVDRVTSALLVPLSRNEVLYGVAGLEVWDVHREWKTSERTCFQTLGHILTMGHYKQEAGNQHTSANQQTKTTETP
ncbi:MAG: PAS domain-containing protein [Leptolyngbya sp. SIO3F4]|nr:PAS domain-containing protein [Leptolyngbya sp. SIO3F4]